MTQITKQDIKKIASLAKIEVAEENQENLAKQVGGIIGWIEKLNEVDTSQVEPLISVCNTSLPLNKDEISDGNLAEDVLRNAKNSKYGYFAVPKVIE